MIFSHSVILCMMKPPYNMDGPLVELDLSEVDVSRVRSLPHVLCIYIYIYIQEAASARWARTDAI